MTDAEGEIVRFDNVGLRYGTDKEVLTDISFTLYPGTFYFLTGASGAGKTSLLRLLYLAQRPSRGGIRMFGTDAITLPRERLPAFRRRLGVVFQDFRLIPHLSAFDNVALPLRVAGVMKATCASRSPTCSNGSGWANAAMPVRRSCRAASSSASQSPAR